MNKRTKALAISQAVKKAVYIRDKGICVLCGGQGDPVAHVVRRSQGGKGIEQNIVCLCSRCHREFDEGQNREAAYCRIVTHLKHFYPDWNRADMIYRKGE